MTERFLNAYWDKQSKDGWCYVAERVAGIGYRRFGPMSAAEADVLIAARRQSIKDFQDMAAPEPTSPDDVNTRR
jgi:hypothetical protein